MRVLFIVVILVAVVGIVTVQGRVQAADQGNQATLGQVMQQKNAAKIAEVMKELTQIDYKAKLDVPNSDSIFVDDGKLVESLYKIALRDSKVGIKAGQPAKVSKVMIMDYAIQVYFTDDIALFGSAANHADVSSMGAPELTELARKTIAALFTEVKK